jgi:hypothetical protein
MFSQKEVKMIRLLFRVTGKDGASTLHSAEVHGSKSALLLDTPNVEIIGFEDCREINPRISIGYAEQIALAKQNAKELREIIAANKLWVPQNVGLNPEDKLVADAIKGQEIPSSEGIGLGGTAMDYRDLYESKEIPPAEMSPEEIGKAIAESISEQRKDKQSPGILYGNGPRTQLWLLLRPNGEFVKSTTEEGGESYIACTSLDEAQKVAEQQKIYDIECVPHRVF